MKSPLFNERYDERAVVNPEVGAIFHGGDCVAGEKWDPRSLLRDDKKTKALQERTLELSFDALHALNDEL